MHPFAAYCLAKLLLQYFVHRAQNKIHYLDRCIYNA